MLSEDKLKRLNELARKKKSEGLTDAEAKERKALHDEYLENFRGGFRHHIEGMKIVDEEGKDVTPEKLKEVQKEKQLHNRHLEED